MSFPRRTKLVSLAVLALAVAAIGAPASFAQDDPYSGEGYGGTMDGGSPLSHSAAAAAEQASIASVERDLIVDVESPDLDSVALDPWMQAALKNRAYRAAQQQPIPIPQPSVNGSPDATWNGFPSDPWADACATFRTWGWALQAC
jgi:hypothetical protein